MSKAAIIGKKGLPATASKTDLATLFGYPANTVAFIRMTITTTAQIATIDKTATGASVTNITIAAGNTVMEDFGGNPVDLSTIVVSTASAGANETVQLMGCLAERSPISELYT